MTATTAPVYDFQGKRVLITGGSQGIGLAIARGFLAGGAEVIVAATRPSASDYATDLSGLVYRQAHMESPQERAALADFAGEVDVLVNNAGTTLPNEFDMTAFAHVLEVNVAACMDLSMRCYPGLEARGGNVINIGSVASYIAIGNAPAYTTSKAALLGMTRALADKWASRGVRVNMIAPGFVETTISAPQRADPEVARRLKAMVPLKRWGQPSDIAGAALFLASPAASYITGSTIVIDGGLLLR